MRIGNVYSNIPSFNAHQYKVYPKAGRILVTTDNNPDLGEKPFLVSPNLYQFENSELAMVKEGKNFFQYLPSFSPAVKYHIHYKDTDNTDLKNGKDYTIPNRKLAKTAALYLRKEHRQPVVHAIKQGKATGKIIYKENIDNNKFLEKINVPSIIITEHCHANINNPNIVGIIYTSDDAGSFSHSASQLRAHTDIAGAIYTPETIDQLKKLQGKNVEIELKDNSISFQETDKHPAAKTFPKIFIPTMKHSEEILTSDKYSSDVIGAKAVNLRRLEELVQQGKIDVIIPKSVGLPCGYISKLKKENGNRTFYDKNNSKSKEAMNNLRNVLNANGIKSKQLMVRSAFNGEDLPNYSAAGIYDSQAAFIDCTEDRANGILFSCIETVANSLKSKKAIESRKKYGIPDTAIKPGIIIQDNIEPEYKFTLYTNDGTGNLKIDLYSDKGWVMSDSTLPHVFTYNPKNKELSYDSSQMGNELSVTFDENKNIICADNIKNDLSHNAKLFEQLKRLVKNALVIEKEFGLPQDIEGGIKDNDIYLWQTRNIVK